MWVPPEEKDPVVLQAPTRKSIGTIGAVNLEMGILVTQLHSIFDVLSFQVFLEELLKHRRRGRKMGVILDNASYHHSEEIVPFLRAHRNVLKLLFLPPYSPKLNPIERVWKLTRKLCTHNQYFRELEDLVESVCRQFRIWANPNSELHLLCGII